VGEKGQGRDYHSEVIRKKAWTMCHVFEDTGSRFFHATALHDSSKS
jgi:hypothetical protein